MKISKYQKGKKYDTHINIISALTKLMFKIGRDL